jgi:hypothetical protein
VHFLQLVQAGQQLCLLRFIIIVFRKWCGTLSTVTLLVFFILAVLVSSSSRVHSHHSRTAFTFRQHFLQHL